MERSFGRWEMEKNSGNLNYAWAKKNANLLLCEHQESLP